MFKTKERLNQEFEKIRAQSTKEHDEMKRIESELPHKNRKYYEDMIKRLDNDMQCTKKFNPQEEARILNEIATHKRGISLLESFEHKKQLFDESKRLWNAKKLEIGDTHNLILNLKRQCSASVDELKRIRAEIGEKTEEIEQLKAQKLELKKQIEDTIRENQLRAQQAKKANQEMKLAERAKLKEDEVVNIMEETLKEYNKLVNYFQKLLTNSSSSLNSSNEFTSSSSSEIHSTPSASSATVASSSSSSAAAATTPGAITPSLSSPLFTTINSNTSAASALIGQQVPSSASSSSSSLLSLNYSTITSGMTTNLNYPSINVFNSSDLHLLKSPTASSSTNQQQLKSPHTPPAQQSTTKASLIKQTSASRLLPPPNSLGIDFHLETDNIDESSPMYTFKSPIDENGGMFIMKKKIFDDDNSSMSSRKRALVRNKSKLKNVSLKFFMFFIKLVVKKLLKIVSSSNILNEMC